MIRPAPVRNLGDKRNVAGLTAIAKALRCADETVRRWTRKRFDPLRLMAHPSRADNYPIQRRDRLEAWRVRTHGREDERATLQVVYGWERIADMCEATPVAARELAAREHDPLPVQSKRRRNPETGEIEVWAYADALRDWLAAHTVVYVAKGGPTTREDVCPPRPKARARAA